MKLSSLAARLWRARFALAYLGLAASFVVKVASFYHPRTGLSSLLICGDRFAGQRLSRLHDLPIYTYRHSAGYDGQFYAQIAVAGNPFDPELRTALDSAPYRARRVLLPALTHGVGLGRPAWVLVAYELSNLAFWMLLAWLLARWWFPPVSLHNLVRWTGVMFGAGMVVSVARSLTDGPALVVIAIGVRCAERNRRWLAAAILGAAGLIRETSVLAAASFAPYPRPEGRAWRVGLLAGALAVLPAAAWIGVLTLHFGSVSTGALDLPLTGILRECRYIASRLHEGGGLLDFAKHDVFIVVATLVQAGFVLGRPRPALAWWRVGACFAVLAFFLGWGFWEDTLSGVPRTLLPLTLAFNILAPRTHRGLALLLAGNLTVLSAAMVLSVLPTP